MVLQRDGSVKPVLSQNRWRKWFSQLTLQKTVEGRKKIYILSLFTKITKKRCQNLDVNKQTLFQHTH
jgi:hypothetical protein